MALRIGEMERISLSERLLDSQTTNDASPRGHRNGNGERRRVELADFLRKRRESITPDEVGLPDGGRRRTPGLRREEVALLAGVGTTWYTWLEQGRDVRASLEVLEAISRALKLTPGEGESLKQGLSLEAGHEGIAELPNAKAAEAIEAVRYELQALVRELLSSLRFQIGRAHV